MKKINSKQISFILLIFVNLFFVLLGIWYTIYGNLMPYHLDYIGISLEELERFNQNLAIFAGLSIRLAGSQFLAGGIINIIVIQKALKNNMKWALYILLISGLLLIGPLLYLTFIVGGWVGIPFPIMLILGVLWSVGMILAFISFEINIVQKKDLKTE